MSLYFSKDDILFIHSKLIDDFGGSDGIRNRKEDADFRLPLKSHPIIFRFNI